MFRMVKREAGANPARTRRCKEGVLSDKTHWDKPGREDKVLISKSEDLPVLVLWNHEDLVSPYD